MLRSHDMNRHITGLNLNKIIKSGIVWLCIIKTNIIVDILFSLMVIYQTYRETFAVKLL